MACSARSLTFSQNENYSHKFSLESLFAFQLCCRGKFNYILYRSLCQQFSACILILCLCCRWIAEIMTKWQIMPTCFLLTPDRQTLARHSFASKSSIYRQFSACFHGWAFCVDLSIAVKCHIFWTAMSMVDGCKYISVPLAAFMGFIKQYKRSNSRTWMLQSIHTLKIWSITPGLHAPLCLLRNLVFAIASMSLHLKLAYCRFRVSWPIIPPDRSIHASGLPRNLRESSSWKVSSCSPYATVGNYY